MIYADYNGSAPLNDEVIKYLQERLVDGPFANPNAIHCLGTKIHNGLEQCRELCGTALGAETQQILFTSGSSEGISTVFHSLLKQSAKKRIILSAIEHSALINTAHAYEKEGFELFFLPVNDQGVVDVETLKIWLNDFSEKVAIVCVMAANNETGVIQPYIEVGEICQKFQVPYFSDTTQLIGKHSFEFKKLPMDFAVCSGHKLGALTGVGLLLSKNPFLIRPLIFGGGQENGQRGGTQNYIGIETLAISLTWSYENLIKMEVLKKQREFFESEIKKHYPQVVIFGEKAKRLAGTTLIAFPGIHGQAVQIELESRDIFVTTSSACSDNDPTPSKVIQAMGFNDQIGRGVIRISLGHFESDQEIERTYKKILQALLATYEKLARVSSKLSFTHSHSHSSSDQ